MNRTRKATLFSLIFNVPSVNTILYLILNIVRFAHYSRLRGKRDRTAALRQ